MNHTVLDVQNPLFSKLAVILQSNSTPITLRGPNTISEPYMDIINMFSNVNEMTVVVVFIQKSLDMSRDVV